jgi:PAS domain S-box-containing protein
VGIPLRVLIVEDSPDDAELLLRELRRGGYDPTHLRVDTREAMRAALGEQTWDLIISDYSMPHFDGFAALKLLQEKALDVPFVIVSGTIGEKLAVAAMKAGAHDYLMKGDLARLVPAVQRELREAAGRRERRRADEALRESEERYRRLVEFAPDAITVHSEGKFLYVNPAGVRLMGAVAPEELIGRPALDLVHPDFLESAKDRSRRIEEKDSLLETIEEKFIRLDGRVIDVEVTAIPTTYGGKRAVQVVVRDITERKRAEDRLREALRRAEESDRLKSAFLANISHEIRTPLNVITGFSSLIGEHLAERGDDSQRDVLEMIDRASKRLINTVHQVLDFSKIMTGSFTVKPVPLRIWPVIEREVVEFRAPAAEKGISLSCTTEDPNATVVFDEYCLAHAVRILVDNAVKFTKQGEISTRLCRRAEAALSFEVRDTGVGIDSDYLSHLFQPFTQEEPGHTRQFEGTGIGLALARKYLELNGARLAVQSEKAKGSVFTIHFPKVSSSETGMKAPEEKSPRAARQEADPPAAKKALLLVVEDDPDSQILMKTVLQSRYEVLTASSTGEARQHLAARGAEVRLILMDISLKGQEDGLTFTRDLRSQEQWRNVPIIATTAHAFAQDRDDALAAGCTAYLPKPFRNPELLSLIEQFLQSGSDAGGTLP